MAQRLLHSSQCVYSQQRTDPEDTQVLHIRLQYTLQDEEAPECQAVPQDGMIPVWGCLPIAEIMRLPGKMARLSGDTPGQDSEIVHTATGPEKRFFE